MISYPSHSVKVTKFAPQKHRFAVSLAVFKFARQSVGFFTIDLVSCGRSVSVVMRPSPVLSTAFLELLAATARARVVTPDVLEHLLPLGFRRSLLSRLNHGSDFFTEFLRPYFGSHFKLQHP